MASARHCLPDSRGTCCPTSVVLEHRINYRFALIATMHMRSLSRLFVGKHQLSAAGWRILGVVGRYGPVFPSGLAVMFQ
jgi:hypothetical protein